MQSRCVCAPPCFICVVALFAAHPNLTRNPSSKKNADASGAANPRDGDGNRGGDRDGANKGGRRGGDRRNKDGPKSDGAAAASAAPVAAPTKPVVEANKAPTSSHATRPAIQAKPSQARGASRTNAWTDSGKSDLIKLPPGVTAAPAKAVEPPVVVRVVEKVTVTVENPKQKAGGGAGPKQGVSAQAAIKKDGQKEDKVMMIG
jgi:hypothetical protein